MSLRIIKAGVLDTIQDCGRYGLQHLGINPNGAMDRFSARLSNALVGKELSSPVIELHFPSSQIRFEKQTVIAICGADFSPSINDHPIPLDHPVIVNRNTILKFTRLQYGARAYLAVAHDLDIKPWMNSCSTNLRANLGGIDGRSLLKNDAIFFKNRMELHKMIGEKDFFILPWKSQENVDKRNEIEFILGSEWHWLTKDSQEIFQNGWFQLTNEEDRMGYRLAGQKLEIKNGDQLVSSAVSFGTVQLLPNGQLIILMADHQTTGGYPRIAYVISAHLPILAQKKPNDVLRFCLTDLSSAEKKICAQQKYLQQLQIACKFKMENLLHA